MARDWMRIGFSAVARYIGFYHHVRRHQSLGGQMPWQVYRQVDLALAA